MSKRTLAILACLGATTIYGINHTIAKGVMPTYIKPFGFIMVRLLGASFLFWMCSFFIPNQKIKRTDWGRLFLCALTGMGINMLTFFKGLELSTPINSAVLITIVPILVVVMSAIFIKEKITLQKGFGIALGLVGALFLILYGAEFRQDAPNIPLGNALFVVNAISYGVYLILIKKLLEKYHMFTLLKWLFTLGLVLCFPITISEFREIEWSTIPTSGIGSIIFVIVGTTFLTYLFNVYGLSQLKASTVSAFSYAQPLIGILFAVVTGKDSLTMVKVVGTVLVILGLYLATKKNKLQVKT
ncbi:DMT family transporter [Cellulophaga omnivescoria]|uniref:DMT family transporter n=1 Tax=Cellulophaga omnivescoria TaxID=1888890 RepID=UPI000985478C|nr:DMT family transporter [Cellulophaga omnivescoria]WBU90416.1 DMT family transporter [Cellulophaga omnivescoria]WKB82535.1 DMT family transporter [Cellulophaga lytica]